ncbi:hypothetical protein Mal65_02650 [Crateriforma conspicua]|nr:hypothetical protein Mal65_02650 [Crateriforma conspicua]
MTDTLFVHAATLDDSRALGRQRAIEHEYEHEHEHRRRTGKLDWIIANSIQSTASLVSIFRCFARD